MPMKGNRVYAAQLALKYDMEVLPIYVVRSGGLKLRVVIEDPIEVKPSGDMASDVRLLAARISERTEVWVREHLTQWYWLPEFRAERGGNYRVTQS